MRTYGSDLVHTVGLFGHGGCGKTTLFEALLLTARAIARPGRVEDGSTVGDYDPDEQKRHQSINLALAPLEWKANKINLIDTPGYADFAGDVAAAMRVCDGAIIVLDAAGGIEVGSEAVWRQAVKQGVPRMLFINKLDRENADFFRTVAQAQAMFDAAVIPLQIPIGVQREFKGIISLRRQRAWLISEKRDGSFLEADIPAEYQSLEREWRESLIDKIAATNDDLIEKYLEGGADALSAEELQRGLRAGIANGSIVPVFCGAADQFIGTAQLLDGILDCIPSAARKTVAASDFVSGRPITLQPQADAPCSALVFKTLADRYGKLSCLRVYSGVLRANSLAFNARTGREERIGQLVLLRGKEQLPVSELGPGDIGVATKLSDVLTGDTLCTGDKPLRLAPIDWPAAEFTAVVKPRTRSDLDKLSTALHHMLEEDPSILLSRDTSGATLLSGLGESHLQILTERMKHKFDVEVELELPKVPYRETIRGRAEAQYRHKKQSGGAGQFAEVTIRVEPRQPEQAEHDTLEFVNAIVGGVIDRSFIPAVEKGVRAAMDEGVLTGNPVVDVRVELFDGKMHPVDSKDIAFQIAGHEAFKLAAQKAGTVILEPIYQLAIAVPDQFAGDIMGDITTRRGRVLGMLPEDGQTVITAQVPLSEILRYATDLRSLTQGRGHYTMRFDHYEDVPAHLASQLTDAQRKHHAQHTTG